MTFMRNWSSNCAKSVLEGKATMLQPAKHKIWEKAVKGLEHGPVGSVAAALLKKVPWVWNVSDEMRQLMDDHGSWAGQPPAAGIQQSTWTSSVMVQISHGVVTAGYNKQHNFSQNPSFITSGKNISLEVWSWKTAVIIWDLLIPRLLPLLTTERNLVFRHSPLPHAAPLALTDLIKHVSLGIAPTWQRSYGFAQRPVSQTRRAPERVCLCWISTFMWYNFSFWNNLQLQKTCRRHKTKLQIIN